jgi:hypothetical protein
MLGSGTNFSTIIIKAPDMSFCDIYLTYRFRPGSPPIWAVLNPTRHLLGKANRRKVLEFLPPRFAWICSRMGSSYKRPLTACYSPESNFLSILSRILASRLPAALRGLEAAAASNFADTGEAGPHPKGFLDLLRTMPKIVEHILQADTGELAIVGGASEILA